MKNNLVKIVFLGLVLLFGIGTFFEFRKSGINDIRMTVMAAHNCSDCATGCCDYPDAYGGSGCKTCPANTCSNSVIAYCISIGSYCTASQSGGYCHVIPTAVPTSGGGGGDGGGGGGGGPTATPVPVCNTSDNNVCETTISSITCSYSCQPCTVYDGRAAQKSVYCKDSCGSICYDSAAWSTPQYFDAGPQCGYCVNPLTPTPKGGCQVYACYQNTSCGSGPGWTDNCNGTGCGLCPGTNLSATPVPTSAGGGGGTTSCNCLDYTSTAAVTCNDTTFYCPGSSPATYCFGIKSCAPPTFNSLEIDNVNGTAVSVDISGKNQICDTIFASSTFPRTVLFKVNASDPDGLADISTVEMRRNGMVTTMTGSSGVYTASIDYSGVNETSAYPIYVRITDSSGLSTGWVDTGRSFKVWDCQVAVSGSVYDSSNGALACNSSFTDLADAFLNFNALLFSNSGSGDDVLVGVNSENDYGVNYLTWNDTYSPYFNGGNSLKPNGDLSGTGRITRVIDSVTSTTNCPLVNQYSIRLGDYVSAYSLAPAAKIDFSFIRNQEGWFQVTGAGIKAKLSVDSGVPATINSALTISGINATNGLVSFTSSSNINGNNSALYGSPNNWWIDKNTNDSVTYSYQSFYNDIYIKNGIGMTVSSQTFVPSTGIYFINDDLYIEDNVVIDTDKYFMAAVKGKIIISENVSRIDGIYVADGGIDALGLSNDQLVINGMLYSRGDIRLARSFIDKSLNNSGPATVVNYRPSLIFNMPGKLMRVLSGWKEE